jgi:integrase/recombinase XerD
MSAVKARMRASMHPTRVAPVIERYVSLKRSLGRGYRNEEYVLQLLDRFVARESQEALPDLTPRLFAAWSRTQEHLTRTVRRNRMRIVRNLCLYRRRTEATCFVPDDMLFPRNHQPVSPHIFTEEDIRRLLAEADKLEPTGPSPLRRENHRVAIILLFTTGIRRGELVRLTLGDFDDTARTLAIRESKFHKSRLVPLSDSTSRELIVFLDRRRAAGAPQASTAPLLWNRGDGGRAYTGAGLAMGLRNLMRSAGIHKPDGRVPRVHDLRHAFAANALLRWYRAGNDVTARLPYLATYMGHVSVASTQLYIPFVEQLAAQAGERFERRCGSLVAPAVNLAPGADR